MTYFQIACQSPGTNIDIEFPHDCGTLLLKTCKKELLYTINGVFTTSVYGYKGSRIYAHLIWAGLGDSAGRSTLNSYRGMSFYCEHFVVATFQDFLRTHQFPRLADWFIHERQRSCLHSGSTFLLAAPPLKFVMRLIRKQCVIYYWIQRIYVVT